MSRTRYRAGYASAPGSQRPGQAARARPTSSAALSTRPPPRQRHVQRRHPRLRNPAHPVDGSGQPTRDGGDRVRVAAEIDGGPHGVLVDPVLRTAHRADPRQGQRPVELCGLIGVPGLSENDGVPSPVVGMRRPPRTSGTAVPGSPPSSATRINSWKIAVPSHAARSPWVSAAIRRPASSVASRPCRAKYTADVAARINAPFPAARWLTWKCRAAARSGVLAGEHGLGLQADVLGVGGGPAAESAEDVGEFEGVVVRQGLADQHRHLGVVGRLARSPAAPSAHFPALPGGGKAVRTPPRARN